MHHEYGRLTLATAGLLYNDGSVAAYLTSSIRKQRRHIRRSSMKSHRLWDDKLSIISVWSRQATTFNDRDQVCSAYVIGNTDLTHWPLRHAAHNRSNCRPMHVRALCMYVCIDCRLLFCSPSGLFVVKPSKVRLRRKPAHLHRSVTQRCCLLSQTSLTQQLFVSSCANCSRMYFDARSRRRYESPAGFRQR